MSRPNRKGSTACLQYCMALIILTCSLFTVPAAAQSKAVARSAADLPLQLYNITDSLAAIIADPVRLQSLRNSLKTNLEKDLRVYAITDTALLKSYYRDLADINFYASNYPEALEYYNLQQSLETKPAARVTNALVKRSQIMAGDPASPGYLQAFREALLRNLVKIPYATAESSLQRIRGQYSNITAAEMVQMARADLRAAMSAGTLNRDDAGYVLYLGYEMPLFDRVAPVVSAVLDSVIKANAATIVDIWPAREVRLQEGKNYKPVVLCVFDLGTDTGLFGQRLYTNPKEKTDGIDNDHNGFVDDIHGVAFDINEKNVPPLLKPWPEGESATLPLRIRLMKGMADLQAARNTPEAMLLKDTMGRLDVAGRDRLRWVIGEMNDYSHGTHVAGIAMEGNPYAQLFTVRMSADGGLLKEGKGFSVELENRVAANLKLLVASWKKANVRVVTMSWGFFLSDYEADLKEFHPEMPEAELKALALKFWTMRKQSLYNAFSLAPEILFIASNGNKNSNSEQDLRYPAALDLANIIGVGSVNSSGQETPFTATGGKVKIHANGYQVESYAPGGTRFLMSGTSMATPYIANLAAKLFAVRPSLTALQVRDLIIQGADISADGKIKLANPKKSFELLEKIK